MHLDLSLHHIPLTAELRELTERRSRFALGHFAHIIRSCNLRLSDANGPRGGVDVDAVALVEMIAGGKLVVRGRYTTPREAIGAIIDRVRGVVQRNHQRVVKSFQGR